MRLHSKSLGETNLKGEKIPVHVNYRVTVKSNAKIERLLVLNYRKPGLL